MPYARTTISKNLSGAERPPWMFVTAFLAACADGDRQASALLERRVRALWDAAAPGRTGQSASAVAERRRDGIPSETGAWVAAMRETAAAQQAVARLQLSVSRNLGLVEGLTFMVARLSSAAQSLTEERDALRRELAGRDDTARELLSTRSLLEDTQHRLQAAERLLARTNRRLDQALRQREEADRLKDIAIRQAVFARSRLEAIEQHALLFADQIRVDTQASGADAALMGDLDQSAAELILSRVDETLGQESSNLDELHGQLTSGPDIGPMSSRRAGPAGRPRPGEDDDRLAALEEAAWLIRVYEVQSVPNLLQTADYAQAVLRQGSHGLFNLDSDELDRRVASRIERREKLLARENPPRLWAIVDESALRRPVGGRDVQAAQIKRLIDLIEEPYITLQIVPLIYGGHVPSGGGFTYLRFLEIDRPDVVYVEYLTGTHHINRREEVESYSAVMERLSVAGARPEVTAEILFEILHDL
jgi:hypothetical protein